MGLRIVSHCGTGRTVTRRESRTNAANIMAGVPYGRFCLRGLTGLRITR